MTLFLACTALYCILHTILADPDLMRPVYYRWWYRFFYVTQSVLLFIPLLLMFYILPSRPFFTPGVFMTAVLAVIWIAGMAFGLFAVRSYDNFSFLGISQLQKGLRGEQYIYERPKLTRKGALAYVRHPYYSVSILLIWARPMTYKDLYLNILLTVYFLLGTINEERKLRKEFGQEYLDYANDVPALVPFIKPRR